MVLTNSDTKRQNVSEEVFLIDRISNLPDSVLSCILSFLPTERVVATSILSKRWRYVWTSVDKLDFDNSRHCSRSIKVQRHFAPFVYKVLKLHQGNIRDLNLSCYTRGCNESDVNNWINTAIARRVERLVVSTQFMCKCPPSIFTCKTLVDLKINSFDISNMNIPSVPFFPFLKKLHIGYVKCDTESLKHIISLCPVLEHISVSKDYGIVLNIVSSTLKWLDLHSSNYVIHEEIHLAVPVLEYLRVDCILPPELLIEEQFVSLVEADINFLDFSSYYININDLRESFVRFIQNFANVKVLRLNFHLAKFLTSVGHAQFNNLTKLEIHSSYFEWRLLVCLMESSVNLKAITLSKTSKLKKHKLAWKQLKNLPTCLSTSLRKISLDGYTEDELPMVKYVLRNAEILERIDIRCSTCYRDDIEWKSVMLQKIQKLDRASQRCEVSLV